MVICERALSTHASQLDTRHIGKECIRPMTLCKSITMSEGNVPPSQRTNRKTDSTLCRTYRVCTFIVDDNHHKSNIRKRGIVMQQCKDHPEEHRIPAKSHRKDSYSVLSYNVGAVLLSLFSFLILTPFSFSSFFSFLSFLSLSFFSLLTKFS